MAWAAAIEALAQSAIHQVLRASPRRAPCTMCGAIGRRHADLPGNIRIMYENKPVGSAVQALMGREVRRRRMSHEPIFSFADVPWGLLFSYFRSIGSEYETDDIEVGAGLLVSLGMAATAASQQAARQRPLLQKRHRHKTPPAEAQASFL